ncbi:MAG TPA: carbohydrate binding family 9 domain-containing protein, partial [Pyrinomonadaceae bacterium]|nr:carbohydrate binding family 9 domain-containing protein [Pyrinomonadaceae bacterium]
MNFLINLACSLLFLTFAGALQSTGALAAGTSALPTQTPTLSTNQSSSNESGNSKEPAQKDTKSNDSTGKVAGRALPPEKANPVRIPKSSEKITIDGNLSEEAWQQAAIFKDFIQTSPGYNIDPSRKTEVLMFYDEYNLYIGFKCWDDPDKIRATVAKRDDVFGEDNVRIWLDTYNDQRRAYIIGFNPLGIQQDGIFTEGSGADFSVDLVIESKGVIQSWGWTVEARIPFKSLRYRSGKGVIWGFNAARNIDRFNDEFDEWMPDDRNITGRLIKHGKITGLEGIKYERTLEIVPSVTLSQTSQRKATIASNGFGEIGAYHPIFNPIGLIDNGRWVNNPVKHDLSLNLKLTLTPDITFDAAINPDFAEIEADAPVVTANQRFPIFFEEKRPFFLEGKEIFSSPLQPFYSRTIIDPDIATKLTGKLGKTSFGLLFASDNAPGNLSEDERGELINCRRLRENDPANAPAECPFENIVDKNALFGVLRLKTDIGRENNLGFFASARNFTQNKNYVGGFDGNFKLTNNLKTTFQILGTHTRKNFYDSEQDSVFYRTGNGIGYYFNLDYTTDLHGFFVEAFGRSKNYIANTGFTKRTNTNTLFFVDRLSTKSRPDGKLIRLNANHAIRYNYDWNNRLQDFVLSQNLNFNFQKNLYINTEAGYA